MIARALLASAAAACLTVACDGSDPQPGLAAVAGGVKIRVTDVDERIKQQLYLRATGN